MYDKTFYKLVFYLIRNKNFNRSGEYINKEWSELNKKIKSLLCKKESFHVGIQKLIDFRKTLLNEWFISMKDLSIEDYSRQPFLNSNGYESKTIAYSIYHVFRIEDIILNTLIRKKEQIFLKDDYKNKMNSSIITTGNELKKEKIALFSKTLIIDELWSYAKKVFEETNQWLLTISYNDLKTKYNELDKERILSTNTVFEDEKWLVEYWCRKNVKGLIEMPFSRHWIMHIEASLRIKKNIKF